MKEQFDKKLVEKIKVSFQDHEEPFNPQEWEKLSHAYFHPVKKKKSPYWPFLVSGIAASLLFVLVFWPIGDDLEENVRTITDTISIDTKQFEKIEPVQESADQQVASNEESARNSGNERMKIASLANEAPEGISRDDAAPIKMVPLSQEIPSLPEIAEELKQSQKFMKPLSANAADVQADELTTAQNTDGQAAQQWIDQWKSDGQNPLENPKDKDNNVRLGLLVGPQTSSNPVSGMSLGAGVMSEFSISNRLKLDIGVTYASHSMVPESSLLRESAVMNSPSPQAELAQSLSNSPRLIGSNAELNFSGLDIPVNLKYKVMDKESSGLFLITGLSSMVYLNQQTTETMAVNSYFTANTNGSLEFQRSVQEYTLEAGPENKADGVDLGRMLNLSIGYEYNLKNGTFLSIEPYYKLPLGDMTFANQQFSIGGLNLRMNFNLGK
jgi:hypothetical protein